MRTVNNPVQFLRGLLLFTLVATVVATDDSKGGVDSTDNSVQAKDDDSQIGETWTYAAEEQAVFFVETDGGGHSDGSDHPTDGPLEPLPNVCEPLDEVRQIIQSLQPKLHAHLDKKLGGISPSHGLGDGLGWSNDGPISTAVRLLPRVLASLNPLQVLAKLPIPGLGKSSETTSGPSGRRVTRVTKAIREKAERLFSLLNEAEAAGCAEALLLRAEIRMFPPRGVKQDVSEAYSLLSRYLDTETSDPYAQFMMGFFHATGLGGADRDQAKAVLYYTFSAIQGYKPAQMAMGYRYWAGIGVKEDCLAALNYYESASDSAYRVFQAGPPGGETPLLSTVRLSDRMGGVFGPHASWASSGVNSFRQAVTASIAAASGETEAEVLEYYQYHSDRDSKSMTVQLGIWFYHGSINTHPKQGISGGAEEVGEIPQSFEKARLYFFKVARQLWPMDFDRKGDPAPKKTMSKERAEILHEPATIAAGYIGRMAMRGEGMPVDFRLAELWFGRAAEMGYREGYNGLGILYRDGLGVPKNIDKAAEYFQEAARRGLPGAQVNLGNLYMALGQPEDAAVYYEGALKGGAPFEPFHHLGKGYSTRARTPLENGGQPGLCGVGVGYFKLVSETGAWEDDYMGEADRAWLRGEEDKALLGWWVAAEMGYEAGQNNVAFVIDRREEAFNQRLLPDTSLIQWTRSAAQGNADAMVMVGDYYYKHAGDPVENATKASPDYDRALSYYQTASDKGAAMAFWNLGYMYENGQGVPQDWHLAKRHYDLSLESSPDAYLPWLLSLTRLYIHSWWIELRTGGATPALSLFEETEDTPGFWEGIKSLFVTPVYDHMPDDVDDYDDYSGNGWQQEGQGQVDPLDDIDDIVESLVILGLMALIMVLFWVRGRWAAAARGAQGQN